MTKIQNPKQENAKSVLVIGACLLFDIWCFSWIMAKKILIIEDEDILRNLLEEKLKQKGYDVSVAKDGQEGLSVMPKIMPDLILLDIIMPKVNGFEVMEKMQKSPNLKEIPVIIVSNSGQPVEIDRAKKLGVKDWLIKTQFDPQEVI